MTFFLIPIGVWLGIFGVGGGILILPLLMNFYNFSFNESVFFTLIFSFILSLFGFFSDLKNIDFKIGFKYFFFSIFGSIIGSFLSDFISSSIKELIFVGIIIFILIFGNQVRNIKNDNKEHNFYLFVLVSFISGILTSLTGVGGGFLIAPALIYFFHLNIKNAISTSFIVMLLNTSTSLVFYFLFNSSYKNITNENFKLFIFITIILLIGFLLGRFISKKINDRSINISYKIFLIFSIILTIY